MPEPKHINYKRFGGLVTSIADPPANTAKDCKNIVLNRRVGIIEQGDGYSQKYDDGGSVNLPQVFDNTEPNYINSGFHLIENLVFENFHNFHLGGHGDRDITVAVGTYKKSGFTQSPTIINSRLGVFVRPYWDGSAWVDEWQELTEMFIFEYFSDNGPDADTKFFVDDGSIFDFSAIDPSGEVFNSDYFVGWVLQCDRVDPALDLYAKITGCGFDAGRFYFQIKGATVGPDTFFTPGETIYVYRNFHPDFVNLGNLPTSSDSYFYNLLDEIRFTVGSESTGRSYRVALRDKEWIWSDYEKTLDRLTIEPQGFEVASDEGITLILASGDNDDNLAIGDYYIAVTLVDELGQESHLLVSDSQTINPARELNVTIRMNIALIPTCARKVRVYGGTDGVTYNLLYERGLYDTDAAGWTDFTFGQIQDFTRVDSVLWDARTTDLATNINRSIDDDGVMRYSFGAVVDNKTYLAGVYDPTTSLNYPNKMFVSTTHGDGSFQRDVFVNDPTRVIDLEFNDGDELIAIGGLDSRIIAIKRRSIVLVLQDRLLGYVRQLVTKGYGMASARSLAAFDNKLYWADYNGIVEYSLSGIRIINESFLQDWRDISDADKEASIAAVDRVTRQYRIKVGSTEYVYDFDTRMWTKHILLTPAARFALSIIGKIDFLNGSTIYTVRNSTLQGEQAFDWFYETNEIMEERGQETFDLNVYKLIVRHNSTVPITVNVYKNESNTPLCSPFTVLATEKRKILPMPSGGSRCSSYRVKLSGSITEEGQRLQILALGLKHTLEPVAGDIVSEQ